MSPKQSPHLPPRDLQKEKEFASRAKQFGGVVLAVILVIAAGTVGAWLAQTFMSDGVTIVERPVEVFVPQDPTAALEQIDQKVLQGVLPVYSAQAVAQKTTTSNRLLDGALVTAKDLQGYALAITNDGWIVGVGDVLTANSVVRVSPGTLLPVVEVVADTTTDLVFAKVEAEGLTPMAFARVTEDSRKEIAAVATRYGTLRAMIIHRVSAHECASTACVTRDIDVYDEYGIASPAYVDVMAGLPILTTRGEVLGMVHTSGDEVLRFVPANVITPVLGTVFTEGEIVRPEFGFTYVDLAELTHTDPQVPTAGAYVVKVTDVDSPFVAKDIITAVNGVALTQHETLLQLLQQFGLGTTVTVQVLRDAEPIEVELNIRS